MVGFGCYYQIFSVTTRPYTRLCPKFLQRSEQNPFYESSKIISMSQQSVREFLAELHARAKRALVAPHSEENLVRVTYPSRKFWWSNDRKSIRPSVRRETNVKCYTVMSGNLQPDVAHSCCGQFPTIKTGYPLTTIMIAGTTLIGFSMAIYIYFFSLTGT